MSFLFSFQIAIVLRQSACQSFSPGFPRSTRSTRIRQNRFAIRALCERCHAQAHVGATRDASQSRSHRAFGLRVLYNWTRKFRHGEGVHSGSGPILPQSSMSILQEPHGFQWVIVHGCRFPVGCGYPAECGFHAASAATAATINIPNCRAITAAKSADAHRRYHTSRQHRQAVTTIATSSASDSPTAKSGGQ